MASLCLGYDKVYISLILSQINNSRKSFIFTKHNDDEDIASDKHRKMDLDTVKLKLKLKIYASMYDFIDDLMKMVRSASEHLTQTSHSNFILLN
jgi:hypothetical protein